MIRDDYAPGRVVSGVHPNYILRELKHPLARLSCLDDASKIVRSILVWWNKLSEHLQDSGAVGMLQ